MGVGVGTVLWHLETGSKIQQKVFGTRAGSAEETVLPGIVKRLRVPIYEGIGPVKFPITGNVIEIH